MNKDPCISTPVGWESTLPVAALGSTTFFSPGPTEQIPPGEGSAARRGGNNNNTMASPRGPVATIAPREVLLIRSGIPLSLTYTPPVRG